MSWWLAAHFFRIVLFFSRPLQPLPGEHNVYLRIARFPFIFGLHLFSLSFFSHRNNLFPLYSSEKHISQLSLFSSLYSSSVAISLEASKTHLLRSQNNIQRAIIPRKRREKSIRRGTVFLTSAVSKIAGIAAVQMHEHSAQRAHHHYTLFFLLPLINRPL